MKSRVLIALAFSHFVQGLAFGQCPSDDVIAGSSCATATPVLSTQFVSGLSAVNGASDWFRVDLAPGESVEITANFVHANGDIDLYADRQGCNDVLAAFSIGAGDSERLELTNEAATTTFFSIEVVLHPGTCNDYSLQFTYLPVPACAAADDGLEDNDSSAAATPIAVPSSIAALQATSGDEDWYQLTQAAGTDLTAQVDFTHSQGDIDLYLYDAALEELAHSNDLADCEIVRTKVPSNQPELRYLQIVRKGIGCSSYDLTVSEQATSDACFGLLADTSEPNDSCATAASIGAGLHQNLNVGKIGQDSDWYTVSVPSGMEATVVAKFLHSSVDIDLDLYAACGGVLVDSGHSLTDDETVLAPNASGLPLEFKLHAYVWTGSLKDCGDYALEITFAPATQPCAVIQDDDLEENDTCLAASVVEAGFYSGLLARKQTDDADWFTMSVPADSRLVVDLFHSQSEGNIDLAAFAACGTSAIQQATTTTDNERLVLENTSGVTQAFKLLAFLSSTSFANCASYELELRILPLDPCTQTTDTYEPNPTCTQAADIALGFLPGLSVRKFVDHDWFRISVPAGSTLIVDALFLHDVADMDLELYGICGSPFLQQAITETDNERIIRSNGTGVTQTFLLHVFVWAGSAGLCNTYDLNIDIQGGAFVPYCFGDGEGRPCPCNNDSPEGHRGGCSHQDGKGARLVPSGVPSASLADSLHFDLTSAARNTVGVLLSGDNQLGGASCIGCGILAFDGLRCAGGNLKRHGLRAIDANGVANAGWGGSAAPPQGLVAQGGFQAGQTRNFYVFYRTDDLETCGTGLNASNGVRVMIGP